MGMQALAFAAAALLGLLILWLLFRPALKRASIPPRPKRVLLVDDEPSIIKTMSDVWGAELGVDVDGVSSVDDAIKRLSRANGVDVVVTDWRFQGQPQQGDDLVHFVRCNFPGMPIEVWTGYRDEVRDVPPEHVHDKPSDRTLRAALASG